MEKLDLTKYDKPYFSAKSKAGFACFDTNTYLSVCGKGDPSSAGFSAHIEALYTTAYAVKFACKARGMDFVVSKLEGLWWFDEAKFGAYSISEAPQKIPRGEWEYRLLIRVPEFVSPKDVEHGAEVARSQKGVVLASEVQWFELTEGLCVQMLHIGPFATEPDTLLQMNAFMESNCLLKNGLHHEIYLSDFRKTAPEKLKTILREPVKKLV